MSFGSVSAATATLKENRNLKKSQRDKFKSKNRVGIYAKEKGESLKFKEISDEELEVIKNKIHLKLKENQKRQLKLLVISTIIGLLVLVWIFN